MKPRSTTTARFFCGTIPSQGAEATLDREESHHATKVLRMTAGDAVDLVDGRGTLAHGSLARVDAKATIVRIDEHRTVAARNGVTLAFGITKGAALDFIVHRLTELGVAEMVPLLTDHSLAPKEWNEERWMRVLRETAKQCQETWFPKLHAPISLTEFLKTQLGKRFAVCDEADRNVSSLDRISTVLVGPEGGWSSDERRQFGQLQVPLLGLGANRLRAETAAVAAAVLAKRALGEL